MSRTELRIGEGPSSLQESPVGSPDTQIVERMLSAALGQLRAAAGAEAAALSDLPGVQPQVAPVPPPVPAAALEIPLEDVLSEAALGELARPFLDPVAGTASAPPRHGASSAPVASQIRVPGVRAAPDATRSVAEVPAAAAGFDVESIRRDFPILAESVHGHPLIWLDNAATTQKPRVVIERLVKYYEHENSNVHRGAHTLAARATEAYESARETVRRFLGAASVDEIVFARGTTEAINLIAQAWGRAFVGSGDEIVLTTLEHHSNIVPWQFLAKEVGARLRVAPIDDRGELMLDEYERLLTPRTRLVALSHVSNALGTVLPARTMIEMAHRHGAVTVVDGAQAVLHFPVDVRALDCDFYVFSGHKLLAPTGVGALYGKRALLDAMPPWQGGGSMIDRVTFESTTFNRVPAKFEAGTGNIADAIGLSAAIEYLEKIGLESAASYEQGVLAYGTKALAQIEGLRLFGTAAEKAGVLSFGVDWMRPEDLGRYLDTQGIAVRAGHHCAQPTMRRFGVSSMVRPSLAFYNTRSEIDALVEAVQRSRTI